MSRMMHLHATILLLIVLEFLAGTVAKAGALESPSPRLGRQDFGAISLASEMSSNRELRIFLQIDKDAQEKLARFMKSDQYRRLLMSTCLGRSFPDRDSSLTYLECEELLRKELADAVGKEKVERGRAWQAHYSNVHDIARCFTDGYVEKMCRFEGTESKEFRVLVEKLKKPIQEKLQEFKKESSERIVENFPANRKARVGAYFAIEIPGVPLADRYNVEAPLPPGTNGPWTVDWVHLASENGNLLGVDSVQREELKKVLDTYVASYSHRNEDNLVDSNIASLRNEIRRECTEEAWEILSPGQHIALGRYVARRKLTESPASLLLDPEFVRYMDYKKGGEEWLEFERVLREEREFVANEATRRQKELFEKIKESLDLKRREVFDFAFKDCWK